MFYYVYKITNTVNGKIYIGAHKTHNINDGYFGSGLNINRAIKKYGKEKFIKEILEFFDTEQDMFIREKELVNSDFIKQSSTYNIVEGGKGSFSYINSLPNQGHSIGQNSVAAKIAGLKHAKQMKLSQDYKNNWASKVSNSLKKTWALGNFVRRSSNKEKIWVTNFLVKKTTMINYCEYPSYYDQGWCIGRKINFNKKRGSYKKRN